MCKISERNWQDLKTIWEFLGIDQELPEKADAAVVGGDGDLTDGAERAAELYHHDVVPVIVVSGSDNALTKGRATEADIMAKKLLDLGVPDNIILRETEATNTAENVLYSARLLDKRRVQLGQVVLIHKPYMTRRFYATALAYWPKPQPKFYVTSVKSSLRNFNSHDDRDSNGSAFTIYAMLGDFARIKEYPKRGWIVKQDIPDKVERAYQRLIADGFIGRPLGPDTR